MKVNITQASLFQYLAEVDPVLRRLEALTMQLTDARKALNAEQVSGPQIIALIDACESATGVLPELANGLLAAREHLAGTPERDSSEEK